MRNQKTALAASILLAVVFIFSCHSGGKSSSAKADGGNNIAKYKTKRIGTQTWMLENLNYAIEGSSCYDNNPANCEKYGRLYNWAAAKKACPSGWRLPSQAEWNLLLNYVAKDKKCSNISKYLRAVSGWKNGAGEDSYGFAALPGSWWNPDWKTSGINSVSGSDGYWWSSSEDGKGKDRVHGLMINYYGDTRWNPAGESARWNPADKNASLLSVRCVSAGGENNIANYKTVKIGAQVWMAENLNYEAEGSMCVDHDHANCEKYGRLYSWATAMALPANCNSDACSNQIQPHHRGICPSGWHIPSNSEWEILRNYVHADNGSTYTPGSQDSIAGKYLKTTSGWDDFREKKNNGEDKYGFAALPGGRYELPSGFYMEDGTYINTPKSIYDEHYFHGKFYKVGSAGTWWGSSEGDISSSANALGISSYTSPIYTYIDAVVSNGFPNKSTLHSVRCIKD